MEAETNQFLGSERIGTLMKQYAIPCIISLLVGALYNIVDQIFIANAGYLGSYGNAANTVVFPLTVIALAVAVMIGDGCCAFVSLSLGKKKVNEAKKSVGNSIVLMIGQRGDISVCKGILFLDHPGDPVLYVWAGDESDHPGGRLSQICHGLHAAGSAHQYHSRSHFYFPLQMGNDGRGSRDSDRTDCHGNPGRLVSVPNEVSQTGEK